MIGKGQGTFHLAEFLIPRVHEGACKSSFLGCSPIFSVAAFPPDASFPSSCYSLAEPCADHFGSGCELSLAGSFCSSDSPLPSPRNTLLPPSLFFFFLFGKNQLLFIPEGGSERKKMTPFEDLGILLQNRWRHERARTVVPVCPGVLTMETTAPQRGASLGPPAFPAARPPPARPGAK